MQSLEEIVSSQPKIANFLLKECLEMKKDTEPDKSADYFEERTKIDANIVLLN